MTTMTEVENPYAGQGSVLLDIGGDIGALVVTMPSSMVDEEVEILPAGHVGTALDPGRGEHHDHDHQHGHSHEHGHEDGHEHSHGHGNAHRQHVAVVNRPVDEGGGVVASLVYPELTEGDYDLMPKGTDDVRLTVSVRGGEVTTAAWPG